MDEGFVKKKEEGKTSRDGVWEVGLRYREVLDGVAARILPR